MIRESWPYQEANLMIHTLNSKEVSLVSLSRNTTLKESMTKKNIGLRQILTFCFIIHLQEQMAISKSKYQLKKFEKVTRSH